MGHLCSLSPLPERTFTGTPRRFFRQVTATDRAAVVFPQFTDGTHFEALLQVRGVNFLQTVSHMGCDCPSEIGSHGDTAGQRWMIRPAACNQSIRSRQKRPNLLAEHLIGANQETGRLWLPDQSPGQGWISRWLARLGGFHWKSRPTTDSINRTTGNKTQGSNWSATPLPSVRPWFSCGVAKQMFDGLHVSRSAVCLITAM